MPNSLNLHSELAAELKTRRLQNSHAILADADMALLVDLVSSRVQSLFLHGRFGTLRQMLYHPNGNEREPGKRFKPSGERWGRWSIFPWFRRKGVVSSPLGTMDGAKSIELDSSKNRLLLKGIPTLPGPDTLAWSLSLQDGTLSLELEAPADIEELGFDFRLYPLYTHIEAKGLRSGLWYGERPEEEAIETCGEAIRLEDGTHRMPALEGRVPGGTAAVAAWCQRVGGDYLYGAPSSATPQGLLLRMTKSGCQLKCSLRPEAPALSISATPLAAGGETVELQIRGASKETPQLDLDGLPLHAEPAGEGLWRAEAAPSVKGLHKITARQGDHTAQFSFVSTESPSTAIVRMAEALLKLKMNTAECYPALYGMISNMAEHGPLRPFMRPGLVDGDTDYAVCVYMGRVIPLLCAATLASRNRHYVDEAFDAVECYLARCPRRPRGGEGIYVVGAFEPDGKVKGLRMGADGFVESAYYHRSSNFAIMLRALLYCHETFSFAGERAKATRALNMGLEVVKGWKSAFEPGWEYVNNPHYTLTRFLLRLKALGNPAAEFVEEFLCDHLRRRGWSQAPVKAVRKVTSGGGESNWNMEEDWSSAANEALAQWLLTGREDCADAVREMLRIVTLDQCFFSDQPFAFGDSLVGPDLPHYIGGYRGSSLGGMADKSRIEMLLGAANGPGDRFSAAAARAIFLSRLAWSLEDSGLPCGGMQCFPGLNYRNEKFVEILNYGAVGLYAYHLFAGECGVSSKATPCINLRGKP